MPRRALRIDARAADAWRCSAGQMGVVRPRHPSTTSLWWSPQTYDVFGVDARDLHADPRERRSTLVHPDDRARIRAGAALQAIAAARAVRSTSSACLRPGRPHRPGSATAARPSTTPAAGRCAASASRMDITERKLAEQALQRRRPQEGRASSRRSRTSCAIRWRRSATPSSCCARPATTIRRWSGAAT